MNDQLERATVTQSNGGKVTDVARGQPMDAERLSERHDRPVGKAQANPEIV
jgi:hypothetical protein